jgi:hypothetical protein
MFLDVGWFTSRSVFFVSVFMLFVCRAALRCALRVCGLRACGCWAVGPFYCTSTGTCCLFCVPFFFLISSPTGAVVWNSKLRGLGSGEAEGVSGGYRLTSSGLSAGASPTTSGCRPERYNALYPSRQARTDLARYLLIRSLPVSTQRIER